MKVIIICFILFFISSSSSSCSHNEEDLPFSTNPRVDYFPRRFSGIKQPNDSSLPIIEVASVAFDISEWSEYVSRYRIWTQTIYFSVHRIKEYRGKNLIGDMLYSTNVTFQMPLEKEEIPYCFSTTPFITGKLCSNGLYIGFLFILDPVFYIEEQFMYTISYESQEERLVVQQEDPPLLETMMRRNYGHLSIIEIPYITLFIDYVPQIQLIVRC